MSEIISAILAKALMAVLEALIARLALHLMRSMRYRQNPSMAVVPIA